MAVTVGMPGTTVWLFGDIASGIPTFVNVLAILLLGKKFLELLNDYKARYFSIGKIDPEFKVFYHDRKDAEKNVVR